MDYEKIVEQANECHRKTVVNKESWLVVPNILKMTDEERIEFFKQRAESRHKFMTINISTWHMGIFPEFHENLDEIKKKLLHEQEDPSCYSTIRLAYDLEKQEIFYNR